MSFFYSRDIIICKNRKISISEYEKDSVYCVVLDFISFEFWRQYVTNITKIGIETDSHLSVRDIRK